MIFMVLYDYFSSSHLRERDKMLLIAVLCGGFRNGFFLRKTKKENVPYRVCVENFGDGHLFWGCLFSHLLHVRGILEYAFLMFLDGGKWSRCLLWHGWLSVFVALVWCVSCRLGWFWIPPECWDADDIASMAEYPNNWTGGITDDFFSTGGFEVAGTGFHLPASKLFFGCFIWRTAEGYGDAHLERCRGFYACSW